MFGKTLCTFDKGGLNVKKSCGAKLFLRVFNRSRARLESRGKSSRESKKDAVASTISSNDLD